MEVKVFEMNTNCLNIASIREKRMVPKFTVESDRNHMNYEFFTSLDMDTYDMKNNTSKF